MTQTIGSGTQKRSMLATVLIWALLAVGALVVISWLFGNLWGLIVAAFWFGLGYFVGKNRGRNTSRY